jgi:hydroxymethylpyrimidine pyrophosphatase-like HAD family hydrolase
MSTLLLSDYDQTLYFKNDQHGTRQTLSLLRKLKTEYDVCIGIVTGNSRKKLHHTAEDYLDVFSFIADFNAGGIWFSDDHLREPTIDAPPLDTVFYEEILRNAELPVEKMNNWQQCADITFDCHHFAEDMYEQFARHYAVFKEEGNKLALYPPRANKVNFFDKLPLIEERLGQRFSKILFLGDQIYPDGNDHSISMSPRVSARWLIRSPEHCSNVLGKVLPFHLRARPSSPAGGTQRLQQFTSLLETRPNEDVHVDMTAAFHAYEEMSPLIHASNDALSLLDWTRERLPAEVFQYQEVICTAGDGDFNRSDRPHRKRSFKVENNRLTLKMRNHETDHLDLISMMCAYKWVANEPRPFPAVTLESSVHRHAYAGVHRFAADIHRQAPEDLRSVHVLYTSKKLSHNMTGTTTTETPIVKEADGCKQAKFVQVTEGTYLLSITFPFGEEGYQLTRRLLQLFGDRAHSINVVGKAGGLLGVRGDIVLATEFQAVCLETEKRTTLNLDTTYDLALFHAHKSIGNHAANIHLGSVACVKGVLVQNASFFRTLQQEGVVAVEMEGFHIARAALEAKVPLRCGYYISDVPLTGETLNTESRCVSYDDLVSSMMLIFGVFMSSITTSAMRCEEAA